MSMTETPYTEAMVDRGRQALWAMIDSGIYEPTHDQIVRAVLGAALTPERCGT